MSGPAAGAIASMLGAEAVIATAIGTAVQAAAMTAQGAEAGDVGKSAVLGLASAFAMQGLQEAGVFGGGGAQASAGVKTTISTRNVVDDAYRLVKTCKAKVCSTVMKRVVKPFERFGDRVANNLRNLPANAEKVLFPVRVARRATHNKVVRYLLNPNHPEGKGKAKFFEKVLGFNQSNAAQLSSQFVFNPKNATVSQVTQYGTKYNQVMTLVGANGRTATVNAVFQNDAGTRVFRLITAFPN